MRILDEQEKLVVKELIRDPRISDNQISINTKVPLKTVNRKRKLLEKENLLFYFAYLNNWKDGTASFNARGTYILVFKEGITKKHFLDTVFKTQSQFSFHKHILNSYLGESNGGLALILVIESRENEDLLDIFNTGVVSNIKRLFGENAIKETFTFNTTNLLNILHNYVPYVNMLEGKIKKEWPDNLIFVND